MARQAPAVRVGLPTPPPPPPPPSSSHSLRSLPAQDRARTARLAPGRPVSSSAPVRSAGSPCDAAERQRRTVRPALPHGPTALHAVLKETWQSRRRRSGRRAAPRRAPPRPGPHGTRLGAGDSLPADAFVFRVRRNSVGIKFRARSHLPGLFVCFRATPPIYLYLYVYLYLYIYIYRYRNIDIDINSPLTP